MAFQAYKVKGVFNATAAVAFVVGFTGQLKSWWDNILTQEMRDAILNHKHTIRNTSGMEVEEEDAVEVLIHTITLHFIGNPQKGEAAAKTIFINRRPILSYYRWYKDVFFTNVLKREDRMQNFWKERFIVGLPKLFGERILLKLQ